MNVLFPPEATAYILRRQRRDWAFLDLADAAEREGGTIGNRTVRLVKAGDGLATTTSSGTKGARADQIAYANFSTKH